MTECFRCGQEGHSRRDCPQDAKLPAARAAGAEAPRARAKDCDPEAPTRHSNACREGNRRSCGMDWCECRCHGNRPPARNDPEILPASAFSRDPSEICPPERIQELAQGIRNQLFKGKPRWLALRMLAWHQVTESRRSRFSLPGLEKPGMPDGAPFAADRSLSASASASFQDLDGLTSPASSNGHAP